MSNEQKKFFHLSTYIPASFMLAFLVGVGMHVLFPVYFTTTKNSSITLGLGIVLLIAGTVLILSAEQAKSPFMTIIKSHNVVDFMHGIYKISRHPTTLGSMIMFFGVGFILNSPLFIITGVVLFIILSLVILPTYEQTMVALCSAYDDYRHRVRRWL